MIWTENSILDLNYLNPFFNIVYFIGLSQAIEKEIFILKLNKYKYILNWFITIIRMILSKEILFFAAILQGNIENITSKKKILYKF